jgi:hypothetical protein
MHIEMLFHPWRLAEEKKIIMKWGGYVPGQTGVSERTGGMNQGEPKFYSLAKHISVKVSPNFRCL